MPKYSIVEGHDFTGNRSWDALQAASDEQLEKWAADENCKQRDNAAQELEDRRQRRIAAEYRASVAPKPKEQLKDCPSDAGMFCDKCGTNLLYDSQFCRKCGNALTAIATPLAPTVSSVATNNPNLGTIVFAGFALFSLVVSFVKGIVPIFLVEAVLWGALALYWHKKKPTSQATTAIVLLLAVAVAAGEGYLVGRQFGVKTYTYLQQGNIQYRVDEAAGRTDRLGTGGWEAVSFDRPAEPIPSADVFLAVSMSKGEWAFNNDVCFDVSNDSGFVLQDIWIQITFDPQPPEGNLFLNLKRYGGAPLDKGKSGRFCGSASRAFPSGSKWSYTITSEGGWK